MAINYKGGGDLSQGGYLSEAGTYHIMVSETNEHPTKKDGTPIDALFAITVSVLDGTTPNQKDKSARLFFREGKPGDEKSQAFAKKKIDRFFLAVGAMTRQEIESKADKEIELSEYEGRQFVAKFEAEEDSKFVSLSFADIFHVDDPAVKDIPKDAEALKLIPPTLRWPGGMEPGSNGSAGAGVPRTPPPQPKAPSHAKPGDDPSFIGDL